MARQTLTPDPLLMPSSHIATAPGRLIYLMGPSGAGKDSLLKACRQALRAEDRCFVAHRYITRAPDPSGEAHVPLSPCEFEQRQAQGAFCLHWKSNGHRYGIGIEVRQWLQLGVHVLVNGSRGHLMQAQRAFPDLLPVMIWADPAVLRQRLQGRGRESDQEIEARLERARRLNDQVRADCYRIDNSGSLEDAANELLQLIRSLP